MAITYDDIHQLVKEPSPKVRSNIAHKVAESYGNSSFTPKANKIALDILRLLLKDTEKQVRLVLAQQLKNNINAPHDIILSLAFDEVEIAEEVLEHSEVLQESDLLELMQAEQDIRKFIAISKRKNVSEQVSKVLIETRKPSIISSVLANSGAKINDSSLAFIIDEFSSDTSVVETLVSRGDLSFVLAEKLYYLVSEKFKKAITKRQLMPKKSAEKITSDARESMILKFLSPWMTDEDLLDMVGQMYDKKRLSNSIILRSICIGEIGFFEAAIAKRVGIPISNARKLLKDSEVGFSAIYRASKLPQEYRDATKIMLNLAREEVKDNRHREADYSKNILNKIRSHHYDSSVKGMENFVMLLENPQIYSL